MEDSLTMEKGRPTVLQGERLHLISVEKKDAARLQTIVSDPLVMKYMTQGSFFSFARSRRILSELLGSGLRGSMHFGIWLPAEEGPIGVVSFQHLQSGKSAAMVGYLLEQAYWHQGLATEALGVLLRYGFQELGLKRVEGRCHAANKASERVMEKNGMKLERVYSHRKAFFTPAVDMKIYSLTYSQYI